VKIGIDISSITSRRTGIGTYTCELVRCLLRNANDEFVLLFNSLRQPLPHLVELRRANAMLKRHRIPGPALLYAWKFLNWPNIESLIGEIDLFHAPGTYMAPQRTGKRVATVHDLSFLDPEIEVDTLGGKYLKWVCEHRLPEMDLVLVNSPFTRREVEKYLDTLCAAGSKRPKTAVTPLGVDSRFFHRIPVPGIEKVKKRASLPPKYILSVGTLECRKNFEVLLRQYSKLTLRNHPPPPLVIVGRPDGCASRIQETIVSLKLQNKVMITGYIGLNDLPAVYQGASLFVFPSKLEGFGLPVLEAMASRVPVVSSCRVGVLELLPDALVEKFDPAEEESLGLSMLDGIAAIQNTARLEKAGECAAEFTWQRCADLTMAAYRSLLSQPK
jgi:alpha-1,3-rhamnosyl/mannosyltransferase